MMGVAQWLKKRIFHFCGEAGARPGGLYSDHVMSSAGHRMAARQRWTPTPVQLQILERIFDQGNGTPSKQKIKEIAAELSHHGQISQTNVYNWFQNRRARSKRKQQVAASNNNNNNNNSNSGELEVETEVESNNNNNNSGAGAGAGAGKTHRPPENLCFQSHDEMNSEIHLLGVLSNPRDEDHLAGKTILPESYELYEHVQDYAMAGR